MKTKSLVSSIPLFYAFSLSVAYADYDSVMPSSINLTGGNQTHNAIATCGRQCWEYFFGSESGSVNIFSNGAKNTLTITATLPPNPSATALKNIPFYINNMRITNVNFVANNFNSILLNNTLALDNASMSADLRNLFRNSGFVILDNSSSLTIKADAFENWGKVSVNGGSTLTINAPKIWIKSYSSMGELDITNLSTSYSLVNNGGTLNLTGTVYNIGRGSNTLYSGVSTIANYGGTINITGDFHNGGSVGGNSSCANSDCGGGNLILVGGSMNVTGRVISEQGGRAGSTLDSLQNSSMHLYGATLKATGGVENKAGSTLTFGFYKGQAGKIEGNLTNSGGKVQVDIAGASAGNHQFITGTYTGTIDVIGVSSNNFVNAVINGNSLNLTLNQNVVDAFKAGLDSNKQVVLNALDSKLNNIYTYGNETELRSIVSDTESGIQSSYVSAPYAVFEFLKSTAQFSPMQDTRNGLDVKLFGGGLLGSSLGGGSVMGLQVSANGVLGRNFLQASFSYGYALSQQKLQANQSNMQAHAFQFALLDTINLSALEVNLGFYGSAGLFSSKRATSIQTDVLESNADFQSYRFNIDSHVGYKLMLGNFSLKPFAGLNQYLTMQGSIAEKGGLALHAKGYDSYMLSVLGGVQALYSFDTRFNLFAKVSYEYFLLNTNKNINLLFENNTSPLVLASSYTNMLHTTIGGSLAFKDNMAGNLELFYKSTLTGINMFGANASFRYRF